MSRIEDALEQIVFFTPANLRWVVPDNRRSRVVKPWNQQSESPAATACQESSSQAMVLSPGFNEIDILRTKFVHAIESTNGTGFTLELGGRHLPQLPLRIGSSKVLDSAVACSLAAFMRLQCPHSVTQHHQHKLYIRALGDMRQAVKASRDVDFEAIFAAMTVLGDYEVSQTSETSTMIS